MAEEEPGILKDCAERSHHASPAQPASRLDVGDAGSHLSKSLLSHGETRGPTCPSPCCHMQLRVHPQCQVPFFLFTVRLSDK